MTKREAEKQAALADLKQNIHAKDVIYTIVRHRSASGMYRAIDCYIFRPDFEYRPNDTVEPFVFKGLTKLRYTYSIAKALGYRYDTKHEAIGVGGCGFDAAHQIVSDLSYALFGDADKLRKEEI